VVSQLRASRYEAEILEGEDRDMMRPIVIMSMQLEPFMS
jgi:hypothetical protein